MSARSSNLIWIDLEMTGLDVNNDLILEIATLVTDSNLNLIAEGPVCAIHQSNERLAQMDEWNTSHHNNSGLVARVQASQHTEQSAEQLTLDFLAHYVDAGASPMCGNSICQDRRFLAKHMPKLANYFHYRNLDVTTLKILAQRWAPEVAKGFNKASKHLALDDIRDSVAELAHYRAHFLKLAHDV
jgi:oligoribonuclease